MLRVLPCFELQGVFCTKFLIGWFTCSEHVLLREGSKFNLAKYGTSCELSQISAK